MAYLGPEGTFTEQALRDMEQAGYFAGLGDAATVHPIAVNSPRVALDLVRAGEADYACVAIESSVDGPVSHTEDALANGEPLQIYHEVLVPVEFSILVRPGMELDAVRTFTTHPVAEAQVRGWVEKNLPEVRFIPASSNAAAAAAVADGEADAAASPARAGVIHGLDALATGVADVAGAYTRFVLVGRPGKPTAWTGRDRTGVTLTLQNRPASLLDALAELSTRGVDMSRISSRPLRAEDGTRMGMYIFHVDIVGHIDDAAVAEALAGLHRSTESVRYLGSWPAADEVVAGSGAGLAGATGTGNDRGGSDADGAGGAGGAGTRRHSGSAPPSYAASHQWIADLKEGRA